MGSHPTVSATHKELVLKLKLEEEGDFTKLKGKVGVIGSIFIQGPCNHGTQGPTTNPGTLNLKQHEYVYLYKPCSFSQKSQISLRER